MSICWVRRCRDIRHFDLDFLKEGKQGRWNIEMFMREITLSYTLELFV